MSPENVPTIATSRPVPPPPNFYNDRGSTIAFSPASCCPRRPIPEDTDGSRVDCNARHFNGPGAERCGPDVALRADVEFTLGMLDVE